MSKFISKYRKTQMLKEAIKHVMDAMLMEQAGPLDNLDPAMMAPPAAPGGAPAPGQAVDPMAAAMDPATAPGDPNAAMEDPAMGGEEEPTEEEEKIPEDKSQGVVEDVMAALETESKSVEELVNTAKASLQDYGLLEPEKKYQALSVVEKLREEDIPELNRVAAYIEKFLLGA